MEQALLKLVEFNIRLLPLPSLDTHWAFECDGYVALVERRDRGFGSIGAAGLLTATGLAPLIWKGERAAFQARKREIAATPDQVLALRVFQKDLEEALRA